MAKNQRINVTLSEETICVLSYLAKRKHKSIAGLTKELIEQALELQEDKALSRIANELDIEGVKTYSHEEAWK
ncbi:hypothetical protein [Candidatus Trichorickettsia mobilis]|uniref:hypothetical protein n=1 Tax=Candidatus Trichorickettsia mobilis TaxID=1346319 RepID=UPI002931A567|nr:hypothetical protein [Candidatus Trichorickettsia mobilis]